MKTKVCSKSDCTHNGIKQPISNFHKNGKYYRSQCKDCRILKVNEYQKKNQEKIKIRRKKYYNENKDQILLKRKEYYYENQDQIKITLKNYREKNREYLISKIKEYRKESAKYDTYNEQIKFVEETRRDSNDNDLIQVKCTYCGKWFNPTNIEISHRKTSIDKLGIKPKVGESRFYCSEECKDECDIYGQISYPKGHKQPSGEVNPEFRKMIFELDNYECQKCGRNKLEDNTVTLHCHHIEGKALNPMIDCDEYNGITFCKACHNWIHSFPGCRYVDLQREQCEI